MQGLGLGARTVVRRVEKSLLVVCDPGSELQLLYIAGRRRRAKIINGMVEKKCYQVPGTRYTVACLQVYGL